MKRKTLAIIVFLAVFAALVATALRQELRRDEEALAHSISGRLEVDPQLEASGQADIVRTDRVALILVDPQTRHPVAMHFDTPLVPPMNFRIGADDAQGQALTGRYTLIAITDKDGEVFRSVPGEVYGQAQGSVALGDQQVVVTLTQPFRGTLFNTAPAAGGGPMEEGPPGPPERTISGTVRATPELAGNVAAGDRMVILLFDPELDRPAAINIVPVTKLPQPFGISIPPGQPLKAGYSLRILTDKDGSPFHAAPGEIVGRSPALVAPGTHSVKFVMDQPYVR